MMGQAQAQLAQAMAFNRTVRNRVLSQRLAKSYCQILLGVLPQWTILSWMGPSVDNMARQVTAATTIGSTAEGNAQLPVVAPAVVAGNTR
jgi:hypothetical protein